MARKAKSRHAQRRRRPQLEPQTRLLIVCEGEKTEVLYFEDARQALGIQPGLAQVTVQSGNGSNPKNIVTAANRLKREAQRQGNAYDSVYCVMDRDEHAHYDESVKRASDLGMFSIKSVPCFEYWLLLHFRNHGAPYARAGNRSPGQCCEHDLKAEWPDYAKGKSGVFTALQGQEAEATRRAKQRLRAAAAEADDNPSTQVHELLAAMRELKTPRKL